MASTNVASFATELKMPVEMLLEQLRSDFGVSAGMSGSGSACFAFLPEGMPVAPLVGLVRSCWGPSAFVTEARIA